MTIFLQEYPSSKNYSSCLNFHLNQVYAFLSGLTGFPRNLRATVCLCLEVLYVRLLCSVWNSPEAHLPECVHVTSKDLAKLATSPLALPPAPGMSYSHRWTNTMKIYAWISYSPPPYKKNDITFYPTTVHCNAEWITSENCCRSFSVQSCLQQHELQHSSRINFFLRQNATGHVAQLVEQRVA